ncbi:T9SS type B sorting domain-containing protein [Subsaximicrobium wynnwilliamsii]|uniref:T9SS type B sorting domain-containing protein n=1 Tax=Subsaximicrobium wynnwilliamsii TaxID=291179 RepID=A0A5C6ZFA6_9FLAO|nr:T9SS type B sorting domain-containing protein [Subsaximicrobium wynnwilliamsii]TXD82801.1 T9SS type B sorting domain-containing protein [Subsaximicrobium wynnwilliamsii]TXD88525.1 T9SS type B sorting domain-containing protein [Subsaximicrobium wynnwilliamsii]TXE02479.1 T9SS type B sorting domain-containing protein [Subsaximicrobium wynnwilliamsii]
MFRKIKISIAILSTIFLSILNGKTQDTPPQIVVSGNQGYCADAPIPIVSSVSIADADAGDDTLDEVFIQIAEGYAINQDLLSLNGSFPNITASWSVAEGKLTLNGPASFNEFTNAIGNVLFETTQTEFAEDKFISINLSAANYLPTTGHYYLYVADPGISWTQAENAAENQEFFGIQGYLATLTSAEEAQLAGEQSPGLGWIGASDAEIENTWKWVTGPEAGTVFWIGQANGTPQNGEFSFWNAGEPNNFNGNEDYAHITDPSIGNVGSWNDLPNTGDGNPGDPYYPKGYYVEFGGMPGDPEINLSASTAIIMPRIEVSASSNCENSVSQLSVTANTPRVLWYASETANTVINEGLTYEVQLNETTTFWVLPLFESCNTGTRIPFPITIFPTPDAVDIGITQCDDQAQDGLAVFNLNAYFEDITNGVSANRDIQYFEDAAQTIPIDGDAYTSVSNPQTVYAKIIDTSSGCSANAEIVLETTSEAVSPAFLEACDGLDETGLVNFDLSLATSQLLEGLSQDFEVTYYESYQDALDEFNVLPTNYTNTTPYNQMIYGRITDNGFCYTIAEVQLRVTALPNLEPDATVYYCLNSFPETIRLSGGVVGDIPNNYYYNWSTGETTINIEVNEIGSYTVEVTPVDGCPKTRTISVLPSSIAVIDEVVVNDLVDLNAINIIASGDGTYEYALNTFNGPYQSSNVFSNLSAGFYTVYVKDVKNDCGIVSQLVSVVGYPKFFTPNGDGYNDRWQLRGVSEQFQPNSKVFIFDRFGKLLKTLNTADQSWDGSFDGALLPSSDYWFSATLQDGRSFTGHFSLKR